VLLHGEPGRTAAGSGQPQQVVPATRRAGCGIDSKFEPRHGASEISPGCSTLVNAGHKKPPKAPAGATDFPFHEIPCKALEQEGAEFAEFRKPDP
jgi:hypothetical protein